MKDRKVTVSGKKVELKIDGEQPKLLRIKKIPGYIKQRILR